MKKDYAVALDNFFPETGVVRVRGGSRVYSALSGPVLALAPHALSLFGLYSNPDGTTHLVRVQAGNAVELETGLTGTRWTSEEYRNHTLFFSVDGSSDPVRVTPSGAVETDAGFERDEDSPDAYSFNPRDIARGLGFKSRFWLAEREDPLLWYTSTPGGVTGPVVPFDLGLASPGFRKVAGLGALTLDGGDGVDDYFVILDVAGTLLLYQGLDPALTNQWFKRGTYKVGRPLGDNPLVNFGGDLLAIT